METKTTSKKQKEPTKLDSRLNEPKQSEKWFVYVFAAEGRAILISRNVLINLGLSKYVLASFEVIVGLHFYPIGMIFKRKFDYYIATGLSAIAITGIILLHAGRQTESLINYGLSLASVCVTISYSSKMVFSCKRLIGQHPNTLKDYKSDFTD